MNSHATQDYYDQSPAARWLALASISISNFVVSVTMSAVNVAVPMLARDLAASAIMVSWVPTAFLLANAIFLLPAGRMADIHGRKKIFLTGMTLFSVSCVMAYVAPNIELLLLTRVLQGIGGAFAFATGLAILMTIFTASNRGTALGIAAATLYLGLSLGPVIGGWFTEHFGWRSVFLFPVVLGGISVTLTVWRLKGEWKNATPNKVDWLGSFIFAVWSSALYIGISMIPSPLAWVLIPAGIAGAVGFYYQQLASPSPLIRFKVIMQNHVFSRSLASNLCIYSSNYPFVFLFSLYLQFIQGMSPASAGKIMVLQPMMMAILAPIAGRLADRFEPRYIATTGCVMMSCAFGILQFIGEDTGLALISSGLILLGIGFGLFTTPNNTAALSSMDKERLGIGSALLNLSRVSGNMIGTATVLLLVTLFIGHVKIEPPQYPALLMLIHVALGMSCVLTLGGAWLSYSRGLVNKNPVA